MKKPEPKPKPQRIRIKGTIKVDICCLLMGDGPTDETAASEAVVVIDQSTFETSGPNSFVATITDPNASGGSPSGALTVLINGVVSAPTSINGFDDTANTAQEVTFDFGDIGLENDGGTLEIRLLDSQGLTAFGTRELIWNGGNITRQATGHPRFVKKNAEEVTWNG